MSENELIFSFLIGLMVVALGTVLMSFMQWRRIQHEESVASALRRLRRKDLPVMTVLLYARNQQDTVEQSLRVLKNNKYPEYDIVVIDDGSGDETASIVRRFCAKYPQLPIRLLRRRSQTSVSEALRAGYRKSQKGSVVLVVTPDLKLDARVMKRAIAARGTSTMWRVALHEKLDDSFHLGDIGAFLEKYFWQSSQYARGYDKETFLRQHAALPIGVRSETDTAGALSVLCATLLIAGTIAAFGPQALWYVWVIATAYGLAVIWLRYGESLRGRLVLTLSIPLALFLIPATSIVRGFSQLSSRK